MYVLLLVPYWDQILIHSSYNLVGEYFYVVEFDSTNKGEAQTQYCSRRYPFGWDKLLHYGPAISMTS